MRERICLLARSIYERGLTHGSTGNISARLEDSRVLITPTGSSFGFLDPADLAIVDQNWNHVSGLKPTKELPLHSAFYGLRGTKAGAVVHLHSHHAVRLSLMPDLDPDNIIPPLTPYSIMQLGHVRLLPYFRPGDPMMGEALANLDPKTSAVILANHGPIVAGADIDRAAFAMEELEASARLVVETQGMAVRHLSSTQVSRLIAAHDLEI